MRHSILIAGLAGCSVLSIAGCGLTEKRSVPFSGLVGGWTGHTAEALTPDPADSLRTGWQLDPGNEMLRTAKSRLRHPDIDGDAAAATMPDDRLAARRLAERLPSQQVVVRSAGGPPTAKAVEIATSSGTVPAAFTAGTDQSVSSVNEASGTNAVDEPVVGMDLPSLLAYVGGQHPAVGQARWRVQEAYAELDQARAMWLPTLQAGMSYHRHDGNYQASNGAIVDVNRNSLQYGLGVGAVGAGTTPRPGALVQFHLADALFAPEIAEKTAWARGHAAGAEMNRQLLNVAVAYLRLLEAQQILSVMEDVRSNTAAVAKLTSDFAETGQGLQSDADRLSTELQLVDSRRLAAQQQIEIATAELVQALSWDSPARIVPTDPSVVPFHLVALDTPRESLIATGLAQRPELKEAQALVAAAIAAYRRERSAPFVPSVLLGVSAGGFGGGLGSGVDNTDSRYDFDAAVAWQVRNLGLGEKAARRGAVARLQQARFEKVERMDSIAREISTAHAKVVFAHQRIETTRRAVETARSSYVLNVQRIRDGHGLPVEALQSIQALEAAQRAYVQAIVEHNIAQFELQYALGWPVCFAE